MRSGKNASVGGGCSERKGKLNALEPVNRNYPQVIQGSVVVHVNELSQNPSIMNNTNDHRRPNRVDNRRVRTRHLGTTKGGFE